MLPFSILKNKLPRTKRFSYEPRYYDPEKEAREQRIKEVEARIKAENGELYESKEVYASRISHAFKTGRQRPKGLFNFSSQTAFLRLIIISFLVLTSYLYLEYGERLGDILSYIRQGNTKYTILGLIGVYIAFKILRFRKK